MPSRNPKQRGVQQATVQQVGKKKCCTPKLDDNLVSSRSESERLWKHVLFGTGTCIGMIEGYTALNLPGDPRAGLKKLRDRINTLITKHEAKHAPPSAPK